MTWETKASAKDVMDEAVKTHKLLQRHGPLVELTSIWDWRFRSHLCSGGVSDSIYRINM